MKLKASLVFLSLAIIIFSGCGFLGKKKADFRGTWESSYGDLTMSQKNGKIIGFYTSNSGQLEGTVNADTLEFRWWEGIEKGKPYQEASSRGEGYFVMSPDGKTFSGYWGYGENLDLQSLSGNWTGTRK